MPDEASLSKRRFTISKNASRKVGDAHLHMPIRKSETQPTAQQVNCGQQFDVLLSEIVRNNSIADPGDYGCYSS
jgi:hypothetical protein